MHRSRVVLVVCCAAAGLVLNLLGIIPEILSIGACVALSVGAGAVLAALVTPAGAAKASVVLVSGSLTLLAGDAVWRVFGSKSLYYRPEEMFLNRWPKMPSLNRFVANARYERRTFGDLAATSGRREVREYRDLRFRSDAFGFPNAAVHEPVDVILLGDSFGAGSGTDQERTWASLLESRYGLNVYNLSIPDHSPWQELMNLKIELPRIGRREGATVLWAIFSGNDLDDIFEDGLEPVLSGGPVARWRVSAAAFRNRSPVRQVCRRAYVMLRGEYRPPIIRTLPSGRQILFRPSYAERARRTMDDLKALPNLRRLEIVFAEMRRFAASQGLRVAVALLPSKEEVYGWILRGSTPSGADEGPSPFSVLVGGMCKTNEFDCIDLKKPMVHEARRLLAESGALLWWADDTHWNETGHAFVAGLVDRELLRSGHASVKGN